jgi:hypothetical protein
VAPSTGRPTRRVLRSGFPGAAAPWSNGVAASAPAALRLRTNAGRVIPESSGMEAASSGSEGEPLFIAHTAPG